MRTHRIHTLLFAAPLVGAPTAASEVLVTADIAVPTVWTADNTYNLQGQIYVLPGADLTIEAGTVIASDTGLDGSLAVARGGAIHVMGTAEAPVIMTSKADVATWDTDPGHPTGRDPRTGAWREATEEWGNLTVMGSAYIAADDEPFNTPFPSPSNEAVMEGLIPSSPFGDPRVFYGGGDDDENSGTIQYLSLRYGGRVVGLNNELNGLSLGGVGRGTDIHHVEVMNSLDDGIEVWGGTVNLRNFSAWYAGDDSFDVDQGWRGKAQFGLLVQGWCRDAAQGSGVGDNAFELDGAEDADWQPVTSAALYNCTVIGQPLDGDNGTAWRDGARAQFRNSVFMDVGAEVVSDDGDDGEHAGYGHNGTLAFDDLWTMPYTAFSTVNPPPNPGDFYLAQSSGNLAQLSDSVFFRNNLLGDAPVDLSVGFDNVFVGGVDDDDAPIQALVRDPATVKGGKLMLPVQSLDPRPKNEALTSAGAAPSDGFFSPASYRGAFAPGENWLFGWTASAAFGFLIDPCEIFYGPRVVDAPVQVATAPADVSSLALDAAFDRLILHYVVGETPGDAPSALSVSYFDGSPKLITVITPPPPGDPAGAELRDSDASVCTTPGGIDFGGAIFSSPGPMGFSFVEFYDRPEDTTVQGALPKVVEPKDVGFVESLAMVGHEYADGIKVHTFQLIDPDGARTGRKAVWVRYDDVGGDQLGTFVEASGEQNPGFDASAIDLAVGDQGRLCLAWTEDRGGLGGNPYVARVAISEDGSEPASATTVSESGVEILRVRSVGDLVVALWSRDSGEGSDVLEVATLNVSSDSWSAPVVVTSVPGLDIRDMRFDILPGGVILAAWIDDRLGADGVYTSRSSDGGASWSEPVFHDCGTNLSFAAAAGPGGTAALVWSTSTSPINVAGTLTTDGGASWEPAFLVDDNGGDTGAPMVVHEPFYDRFGVAWSADVGGTTQPFLGGFRAATITPVGWSVGATGVGYDFAGFAPTDDIAFGLASLTPGSFSLADGRDVGIFPDALSTVVISAFGSFTTPLGPGGSGSSGVFPIVIPPSGAGLTFYSVGAGFDLTAGTIGTLTSVTSQTLP